MVDMRKRSGEARRTARLMRMLGSRVWMAYTWQKKLVKIGIFRGREWSWKYGYEISFDIGAK